MLDDNDPCGCPLAQTPEIGPHTVGEHYRESCGGVSVPAPCGGCYDCILAQWAHYERLAKAEAEKKS